jgi:ketosteroid isomerase-like protein
MLRRFVFLLGLLLGTASVGAMGAEPGANRAAVLATIHQFMDGLNNGDVRSALAACAPDAVIIDDFPPHHWQGRDACSKWLNAFAAYDKAQGISGDFVKLGAPRVTSINKDYAYVVLPATYTYRKRGMPMAQKGATFTVALQKMGGAWRITGWAWAQP